MALIAVTLNAMATAKQAKQAQAPEREPLKEESKQALASFDAAIAPLEERVGRPLNGPWRPKASRHFAENAEGFVVVRDDLLGRRGVRCLFALFMKMLHDGDHLIPPGRLEAIRNGHAKYRHEPPPPPASPDLVLLPSPPALAPPCPSCEMGGGHHVDGCELA